jgi:hypothetical protein
MTRVVTPVLSQPLRDIKPVPPTSNHQIHPVLPALRRAGAPAQPASTISDPVVQGQTGIASMPATIRNFEGVSNVDGVLPPDTEGDVGPNHYVQWVNTSIAVWDKSGTLLLGPVAGNALWSNVSDPCATQNDGDPIVLYDHLVNRWLLSQPARPSGGPYYQCIAISQNSDPLGSYTLYDFRISDTQLNDYPHFGVWPDGYYMSINQFANGTTWNGAAAVVFERDKMLLGQPAHELYFDLFGVDPNFGYMLPSELDGPPPPAGTPNYFVEVDDSSYLPPNDALRIWQFHVDWATLNNSTFGINGQPDTILNTAPFNLMPCTSTGSLNCIPQKGSSQKLDAQGYGVMYRLQYRNFVDHQSLVVNHTVDAGAGRAGIRWYEVRNPGSSPTIYQQGTYAPTGSEHRWMGSAAMDRQGNLAIGFSVSGTNTFPSIRYSGRLASDPLGSLPQGEATLRAGGGAQTNSLARWGDYTMLAVDPTDDCTFWYTNEYLPSTSDAAWQTRIGSFRFPSCTGSRTGNVIGVVTNANTGARIANATVRVGANTTTTNGSGVYRFFNLPVGTYSLTTSASGFTPKTQNGLSVIDRATTTQNVALQPSGTAPPPKVYLPLLARAPTPTPNVPVPCNEHEDNAGKAKANPFPGLGKTCYGDFNTPSSDVDDWYSIGLTAGQRITVVLSHMPAGDDYDPYLYLPDGVTQGGASHNQGNVDDSFTYLVPTTGTYYIQLYAFAKGASSHTYYLSITSQ